MRNIEKYKDDIESNINVCGLHKKIYKIINEKYPCDCCCNCDKCYDDCIRWLAEEYKEPAVLDDVEREYLSAVIKPFRKKVKHIVKINLFGSPEEQFIRIVIGNLDFINLPNFNKNTGMYKGMEGDKLYSLEELGL